MNKKILIGSIIIISLLFGVSFNSVVGDRSVESNVKPSPLFIIRSRRAIDEESKDFICDYVGKGEEVFLSFPKRDNRNILIRKFIEILKQMDKEQLKQLKDFVYKQTNINNLESIENLDEIDIPYQLRTNIITKEYNNVANINFKNLDFNTLTEGIGPTIIKWENDDCLLDRILYSFITVLTIFISPILMAITLIIFSPIIIFLLWFCYQTNTIGPL